MFVVICFSPSKEEEEEKDEKEEKEEALEYTDLPREKQRKRLGAFKSIHRLTHYLHVSDGGRAGS